MAAWRYEFYFRVVKTIFYSLCSFVKYCFHHSKIKFISSCHHVYNILYILHALHLSLQPWDTRLRHSYWLPNVWLSVHGCQYHQTGPHLLDRSEQELSVTASGFLTGQSGMPTLLVSVLPHLPHPALLHAVKVATGRTNPHLAFRLIVVLYQ